MKTLKFTLLIIGYSVVASVALKAQSSENTLSKRTKYYNTVSYYPLSALGSGFEMGYESFMHEDQKSSLFILGGAYVGSGSTLYNANFNVTEFYGIRTLLNFRFYVDPDPEEMKDRLFFGPYFMFKHINVKGTPSFGQVDRFEPNFSVQAFGPGMIFGGTTEIAKQLVFTAYVGSGLVFNTDSDAAKRAHINVVNPYERGIGFQFGLGLGYRF